MLAIDTSMPEHAEGNVHQGRNARTAPMEWVRRLISISHRSMAVCGLLVVAAVVLLGSRAEVRENLERWTLDWLLTRYEVRDTAEPAVAEEAPAEPATSDAAPPVLGREQKAVALWISRRYRVAPEPIGALVQEAWALGRQAKLEPTLILAIMAVESSFNPFAQSAVGAQGLMQVMTAVHDDKYEAFGGTHAAFDPMANLKVGVTVLKECVLRAGGSLEGGLRLYVGATNLEDDGGYAAKVMAEQAFLRQVAQGRDVPVSAKWTPPAKPATVADSGTNTAAADEKVALLQ
jgi:hypothetical protein